jgi:hypothetical protein
MLHKRTKENRGHPLKGPLSAVGFFPQIFGTILKNLNLAKSEIRTAQFL